MIKKEILEFVIENNGDCTSCGFDCSKCPLYKKCGDNEHTLYIAKKELDIIKKLELILK